MWTVRLARQAAILLSALGAGLCVLPARAALTESDADALRPGQYLWSDEPRGAEPVSIVVSLPAQAAYVYQGGRLLGVSTVSTGRQGHRTPAGAFPILQKRIFHRSNLYSNAPMPYMQRLTWDGIALHGGLLPGYPASHGCIRLPQGFARNLFGVTEIGSITFVTAYDPRLPDEEPAPAAEPRLTYVAMEY